MMRLNRTSRRCALHSDREDDVRPTGRCPEMNPQHPRGFRMLDVLSLGWTPRR
jgi:hypothetical protein